jgi:hypothetical protein
MSNFHACLFVTTISFRIEFNETLELRNLKFNTNLNKEGGGNFTILNINNVVIF